ncbi:hypothetical protein AHAS_Ahas01G0156800 [Arachis hypogaea]
MLRLNSYKVSEVKSFLKAFDDILKRYKKSQDSVSMANLAQTFFTILDTNLVEKFLLEEDVVAGMDVLIVDSFIQHQDHNTNSVVDNDMWYKTIFTYLIQIFKFYIHHLHNFLNKFYTP